MLLRRKQSTCLLAATLFFVACSAPAEVEEDAGKRHLLLIAGPDSHGPDAHEFEQGMRLFAHELQAIDGLAVSVAFNGWPEDASLVDQADAIVVYADGLGRHPVIQEQRLAHLNRRITEDGMGVGMIHFAVHVPLDLGREEFKDWIGGYYETDFSCNPMWTAEFEDLPEHPIATGVEPFKLRDEWYFNIRFCENRVAVIPILIATPSDETRDGPYVHPEGPYPHIQAAKGREEVLMWAVERGDGGRGFGFTGGHYHKSWDEVSMRRIVLNAMLWVAKVDIPEGGAPFTVSTEAFDAGVDVTPVR